MSPAEEEAEQKTVESREEGGIGEGRRHLSAIERRRLKKLGASCVAGEENVGEGGARIAPAVLAEGDAASTGRTITYNLRPDMIPLEQELARFSHAKLLLETLESMYLLEAL